MFTKITMTPKARALTGSRKKAFYFSTLVSQNTASLWDGGSRSQYSVINMETGARKTPPAGSYPDFVAEYTLQENELLIKTSIFCGKPATPMISCRPEDAEKTRAFLSI